MAESDRLLRTIEAVHAAGLDEGLWPDALDAITQTIGGAAATLESFDRQTMGMLDFHSFGLPPAGEIAYLDEFSRRNPRLQPMFAEVPGKVQYDYAMLSEGEMDDHAFYAEFLASTDYRYFVGGAIEVSKGEATLFSVQRTRRQGHVQKSEIALMGHLLPHIRQANDVVRRLRNATGARCALEETVGWLADGAGLLREDGSLLYANAALQAIARQVDGLRVSSEGEIEFCTSAARKRFAGAIAAVRRLRGGNAAATPPADFSVPRPSCLPSYIVSVRPLMRAADRPGAAAGACAMLFVRDPARQSLSTIGMLRDAFGFTAAEANLARALQAGASPVAYARENGLSLNTVYTHLRRIREKTGCRRQGELVRRLNDILMPLRDD